MKFSIRFLLILFLLLLSACQVPRSTPPEQPFPVATVEPSATPDLQATVDASVKATTQAQQTQDAAVKSTVDVAVQSTVAALPPTATPVPTVEAVTLSEEELAALIDQAVAEAAAATTTAASATTQSASDNTVTEEEVQTVEVYVQASEQALAYAEQLVSEYTATYGDYGEETLLILNDVEDDLASIAASVDEIATVVEQGSEQASAAAAQLQNAAATAQASASAMQDKAQQITQKLQAELELRSATALNMPPTQVAEDLPGTINQLFDFATSIRDSLGDNKITPDEMNHIAQLASNSRASLEKSGGPQLKALGNSIEQLTGQLARGQWPQARGGLDAFEKSLPERRKP